MAPSTANLYKQSTRYRTLGPITSRRSTRPFTSSSQRAPLTARVRACAYKCRQAAHAYARSELDVHRLDDTAERFPYVTSEPIDLREFGVSGGL